MCVQAQFIRMYVLCDARFHSCVMCMFQRKVPYIPVPGSDISGIQKEATRSSEGPVIHAEKGECTLYAAKEVA